MSELIFPIEGCPGEDEMYRAQEAAMEALTKEIERFRRAHARRVAELAVDEFLRDPLRPRAELVAAVTEALLR